VSNLTSHLYTLGQREPQMLQRFGLCGHPFPHHGSEACRACAPCFVPAKISDAESRCFHTSSPKLDFDFEFCVVFLHCRVSVLCLYFFDFRVSAPTFFPTEKSVLGAGLGHRTTTGKVLELAALSILLRPHPSLPAPVGFLFRLSGSRFVSSDPFCEN